MEQKRMADGPVLVGGGLIDDGIAPAAGDAYEWGHGDLTFRKVDGQTVTSPGRFLTVWRRSADGRWRIIRNLTF
jgi:ketosteroid isomerase-like protein